MAEAAAAIEAAAATEAAAAASAAAIEAPAAASVPQAIVTASSASPSNIQSNRHMRCSVQEKSKRHRPHLSDGVSIKFHNRSYS